MFVPLTPLRCLDRAVDLRSLDAAAGSLDVHAPADPLEIDPAARLAFLSGETPPPAASSERPAATAEVAEPIGPIDADPWPISEDPASVAAADLLRDRR